MMHRLQRDEVFRNSYEDPSRFTIDRSDQSSVSSSSTSVADWVAPPHLFDIRGTDDSRSSISSFGLNDDLHSNASFRGADDYYNSASDGESTVNSSVFGGDDDDFFRAPDHYFEDGGDSDDSTSTITSHSLHAPRISAGRDRHLSTTIHSISQLNIHGQSARSIDVRSSSMSIPSFGNPIIGFGTSRTPPEIASFESTMNQGFVAPLNSASYDQRSVNNTVDSVNSFNSYHEGNNQMMRQQTTNTILPSEQQASSRPGYKSYWETLDCRRRCHPYIAEIDRIYLGPSRNCDVIKEGEGMGRFLIVEQYHSEVYDYVKCWVLNNEFPVKMMIIPSRCFPDGKPKIGANYDTSLQLIMTTLGKRTTRILRLKFGSNLKEYPHPLTSYYGKNIKFMGTPDCWTKILQLHCMMSYNHDGRMITRDFHKILYHRSQVDAFPEGAHAVEGLGWLEPYPGSQGTLPKKDYEADPQFYLTGRFSESMIVWEDPHDKIRKASPPSHTEPEIDERYRYEWQPKKPILIPRRKKKTQVAEEKKKPEVVLMDPTSKNITKMGRILNTIEILKRIRKRPSLFAPLRPDNARKLECEVGDRTIRSRTKRLESVTRKLYEMIASEGPFNWLKEKEPDTLNDLFIIFKMNMNYLPKGKDTITGALKHAMYPETKAKDSDHEAW